MPTPQDIREAYFTAPNGAASPDDLPTVTVTGHFDWKFWAGVGLGLYALYILTRSGKRAARHG